MKDRITRLRDDSPNPEDLVGFEYHTEWPRGPDGIKRLEEYLRDNLEVKVVVIDTLARVKPPAARNTNAYESDYAALAPYQTLASKNNVTVILVTHTKKAPSQDSFDDITGSLGQSAAVDGMMMLERAPGGQKGQLILRCRGRDLDGDQEMILARDKTGHFSDRGTPEEVASDSSRFEITEHLQDCGTGGATAAAIHKALGRKSAGSTRNLLKRMVEDGLIVRRDDHYLYVTIVDERSLPNEQTIHPPHHSRDVEGEEIHVP